MGRISQYPLDEDIQGNDKWIGTSVINANATKNFSVDKVAEYLNKSGSVDSQNLRYTYQNAESDLVRLSTTISFPTPIGDNVPFVDITEWIISAFAKPIKDVRTYYDAPLVGSTILITHATNPSNWAIFRWDSVAEYIDNPDFYTVGLTHIDSAGGLEVNEEYLIALLDYGSGSGGGTWGSITGVLSNQTDLQNALNAKFDDPTGTSTDYLDGTGAVQPFPTSLPSKRIFTVGRNQTGATLYRGTVVYINGSTGNLPTFAKALANSDLTSAATFGIIENDIPNNSNGNCITFGDIENLDTRNTAPHPFTSDVLADGDSVYLSPTTAGYITKVKPYAPNHLVYIGTVIRTSPTNGTIVYRIQNGYELDELHNVAAQNPADKDLIQYSSASSLWEKKSLSAAGIQPTLVSGTNIQSINGSSILTSGNLLLQVPLVSGSNIKTINSTSLLGSGDVAVQDVLVSGTNIKTINGTSILGSGNIVITTSTSWGGITGVLSNQIDLQNALNAKQDSLVSGTNIKTINSSSLLGAGDIAVQATLVSGTNIKTINSTSLLGSGDITVQPTLVSGTNIKTINGSSILGSGNLVISPSTTWGSITGALSSQTDLQSALNAKQDTLVSGTNIKTINGTSVLGSGNISISAGASGVAGAIQFSDGANLASDAVNLDWDNTNKRLGVGTDTPSHRLHIKGTGTTASTTSLYSQNSDNTSYLQFNDSGVLTIVGSTSTIFQTNLSGTRVYNINSLGGFGSSKVNVTGVMDLHSNDGTLALRVNDAFTGILKPTAIGQITAPASQAILELVSTTSGFLPPRMTTAQRDAIATPPDGLLLYNTTSKTFQYRINNAWEEFGSQSNAITAATAGINTAETIVVQSPVMTAGRFMTSTIIKISFSGTNTSSAAGTHTFRIRVGTAGTTADTLVFTATTGNSATSGTNIAFSGEIILTIRTVGASATAYGTLKLWNAGSTGISTVLTQVINGTMSTFNSTTANFVSFSCLTSASTTTNTFQQATIEIID